MRGLYQSMEPGRSLRLGEWLRALVAAFAICGALASASANAVDVVDAGGTARALTRVETRTLSLAQLSKLDVSLNVLQGSAYADLQLASDGSSLGLVPEGGRTFSSLGAGNYLIYIYSTIPGNYSLSTLATAVPEPSYWAVLVSGILLVVVMQPFRRRYVKSEAVAV